ncbi:hypothetical protein BCR33DRAFT_665226 [Rhizoclosmatium globosum]|uniref:COX assembly mitochondrial protein n=1 Tax=Rhizoclosmatium globosum TaxID=329046 RepID=A0A1Y2BG76_9FUNG|nr:hypothetical protein HDU79_006410 [Rhizoclosmatium sp. JEL0117]ORY33560.1 hypothetical protein BCR33DRAFT_665226 [Rhizoclosmatium globosum]|eukprot:ORY33560.1 hypothetical protein BCR33DRAFT_665226 [Rhizoclosmatium globosum]
MTEAAELTLPPYFPLKLKKCADVSDSFFDCFDFNSAPNGDRDVGRQALIKCGTQLKLYKECMDKFKGSTKAERKQ